MAVIQPGGSKYSDDLHGNEMNGSKIESAACDSLRMLFTKSGGVLTPQRTLESICECRSSQDLVDGPMESCKA